MRRAPLTPWLLGAALAASAGVAEAQSLAEAVVQQLREQGYVEFAVTRTLLGRVRVVAQAADGEQREIVFNPATGEILRDYSEAADGNAAPRVLDRSDAADRPRTASSPPGASPTGASQPSGNNEGSDPGGEPQQTAADDGNRGHGNDDDGSDDDNPGRGPGNGNGNGGNSGNPSRGGGNGNGKD